MRQTPIFSDVYRKLESQYVDVMRLLNEEMNPPGQYEPYYYKFNARTILFDMQTTMEKLKQKDSIDEPNLNLIAMMAFVYLSIALICLDFNERSDTVIYLDLCQDIIKGREKEPEIILISVNMYNNLGIFWSIEDEEKAKVYLMQSELLYKNFKLTKTYPIEAKELFCCEIYSSYDSEIAMKNLEKLHTFTCYFLAQVYSIMKESLKSAMYCHLTLKRQLESDDYNPIEWALNCATLSQVFLERHCFDIAKHHLAASSSVLDKYENTLKNKNKDKLEAYNNALADVARCWAKYGLYLLEASKERLMNDTDEDDDYDEEKLAKEEKKKEIKRFMEDLLEIKLDENIPADEKTDTLNQIYEEKINTEVEEESGAGAPATKDINSTFMKDCNSKSTLLFQFSNVDLAQYESQITSKYILTLQDARSVFFNVQNWLNQAEKYYKLDTLASDYIQIVLDRSKNYLRFLFFDDNMDNQAKLHKRRANMLEDVLKKVSHEYYLKYCRDIWLELAQIYNDILNIKADKLDINHENLTSNLILKINSLATKSINNYQNFINSVKNGQLNDLHKQINAELEKPLLLSHFHTAVLYGRYINVDIEHQLNCAEAGYKIYKNIQDYCELHKKAKESINVELSMCNELVKLLEVKIITLKQTIQCNNNNNTTNNNNNNINNRE